MQTRPARSSPTDICHAARSSCSTTVSRQRALLEVGAEGSHACRSGRLGAGLPPRRLLSRWPLKWPTCSGRFKSCPLRPAQVRPTVTRSLAGRLLAVWETLSALASARPRLLAFGRQPGVPLIMSLMYSLPVNTNVDPGCDYSLSVSHVQETVVSYRAQRPSHLWHILALITPIIMLY